MSKSDLEQLMDDVVAELGSSASTHAFGRAELHKHRRPPFVCWIEADSDFAGTEQAGGQPRKLWVEQQTVEVHLWATSAANLKIMRNNEIVALQKIASTSANPRRQMPVAEAEEWMKAGAAAILTITIDWPIRDEIIDTTTIDGWEWESDSTPGDGWIEHGES